MGLGVSGADAWTALALFGAAYAAGVVNAIAGGGTLLTFPALLAGGLGSVAANATSTAALVPGSLGAAWGLRRELQGSPALLAALLVPSVVGGGLGALAVHRLGDAGFEALAPWLTFGATALFLVQGAIRRATAAWGGGGPRTWALAAAQLPVALYGGFFGAGIGILMLAVFGLLGLHDIHRMNGLKNLAAASINLVAAITFAVSGRVDAPWAAWMAVGALLGGYSGARFARWLGPVAVRRAVVAIGLGMTVYLAIGR